jgi:hypothetical protein
LPKPFHDEHDSNVKVSSLEAIFLALQKAGTRYLVVGGLAVIAHGHRRFTHDLDLVLDFSSETTTNGLRALQSLGYRPRIPVDLLDFANPELRKQWQEEKGMKVFNIFSNQHQDVTIDLFPSEPFPFEVEYGHAVWYDLTSDLKIPVVSMERLIAMKLEANRPQDQIDVAKLKIIQQLSNHGSR